MWRWLPILMVAAALAALMLLPDRPKSPDGSMAAQEAEQAKAPFQLRLRQADGAARAFSSGGDGHVVIQPERLADFVAAVGAAPGRYPARGAGDRLAWYIEVTKRQPGVADDLRIAAGGPLAWPGGNLALVDQANSRLPPGVPMRKALDQLGYDRNAQLLAWCGPYGNCKLLFNAGRFKVRVLFRVEDRALIRAIAADLRRCLPQWDGRTVEFAVSRPGCS